MLGFQLGPGQFLGLGLDLSFFSLVAPDLPVVLPDLFLEFSRCLSRQRLALGEQLQFQRLLLLFRRYGI
jgi:hypothetical protein